MELRETCPKARASYISPTKTAHLLKLQPESPNKPLTYEIVLTARKHEFGEDMHKLP